MEIKIAVSTNKNFYKLSLPILLESLYLCGINKKDIIIFNTGFESNLVENIDGVQHRFLKQNSFEYSPLIDIVENNLISDYWFLIHDTCRVGYNFKKLLYNIPSTLPNKISLKDTPSMSIGSYKFEYLNSVKEKLLSIKNEDFSTESLKKWKIWGVPNEDFILWKTEPKPIIYNNNPKWDIVGYENWYNTKTIRRTEYYHSLDLYKNKSNWGQSYNMTINL